MKIVLCALIVSMCLSVISSVTVISEGNETNSLPIPNIQAIRGESDIMEYHIKNSIESLIDDYYKVSVFRVKVNADFSSSDEEARVVNVYLEFGANNGTTLMKKLLEGYSNDIAGRIAKFYSDKHLTKINLFWEAPYFMNEGNTAKYLYEIYEGWLILNRKLGPIYGVN